MVKMFPFDHVILYFPIFISVNHGTNSKLSFHLLISVTNFDKLMFSYGGSE